MSNQIIIPQFLINDSNFCLSIDQKNSKMFDHVDYLRQLVTNIHQIYLKMCKRMAVISDQFKRKVVNTKNVTAHAQVVLNFMKNLDFLHLAISSQLNNNNVTLGTKSHKIVKNRLEILHQKLVKSHKLNQIFVQKANKYNEKQLKYQKQCNYFNNYQKDVLKYYSMKQNSELYEVIVNEQNKLKHSLDQIYEIKDEYRINISEIRNTQKEYFEMQKNIISEYKKLFQYIKKIMCEPKQVYNQPIIEEKSEEGNTTIHDMQSKSIKVDRLSVDKGVTQLRKDKIKEFHACLEIEEHFFNFLAIFQEELNCFGSSIDQIRSEKQFKTFIASKLVMSEILSLESITEIDYIVNEVSQFRATILNLTAIFGKIKLLIQLQKYRGLNFDKFLQESTHCVQIQKKYGASSETRNVETKNEYKNIQHKYECSNNEYMVRFREKIVQIQSDIDHEYAQRQQIFENKNRRSSKNNTLEERYYQVLAKPFFVKKQQNVNFTTNTYLNNYSALLNANQVQKIMTLSKFQNKKKPSRKKVTCCGLFCIDEEKGPELINQYYCSLKDDMMLVQGKLSLYQNYINFYSPLNSKTLFGYCDYRIPKWDILQFVKDKHLLSLLIIVETSHGKIGFTSFLTDPYHELVDLYDHRKSGATLIKVPAKQQRQLQQLQQRFQRESQDSLQKHGFKIDKLSTYLSEDKLMLSISIEFHINGTDENILFQIKLNQTDIALEYYFIHDQKYNQIEVKQKLESIAKELIARNNKQELDLTRKKPKSIQNSFSSLKDCSVILPNENNKISLRQPSFIHIKLDQNMTNQIQEEIINQDFTHLLSADSRNYSLDLKTSNAKSEPAEFQRLRPSTVSRRVQIPEVSEEITTLFERAQQKTTTKSNRSKKPVKESREYRLILYVLGVVLALNIVLQQIS